MQDNRLIEQSYLCPYCGESITTWVDLSQGSQDSIEDCSVCCRPIELIITIDGGVIHLTPHTDSD